MPVFVLCALIAWLGAHCPNICAISCIRAPLPNRICRVDRGTRALESDKFRVVVLTPSNCRTLVDTHFLSGTWSSSMRDEPLTIEDLGVQDGMRWLKLSGPITIATLFEFQSLIRSNNSASLALDFAAVPYIDSAGVGALVGAYVRHQKNGHKVILSGVSQRVRGTLQVTQVEKLFEYRNGQ